MWPFDTKISTASPAMSGVLTCDGKHHYWSRWKDVIIDRTVHSPWMKEPETFRTNAQERECIVCHYKERRSIDTD